MKSPLKLFLFISLQLCAALAFAQKNATLRYVGSSTIANYIREADDSYPDAKFSINSEVESAGGEQSILSGQADIAGIAREPDPASLKEGITATLIGYDAIAVVVNKSNPVKSISRAQLKDIFTGKITNWSTLGGPDKEIHPFIVKPESATHKIFRSKILGKEEYMGCEEVSPDVHMLFKVQNDPYAIGQISFSFLGSSGKVSPVSIDGQEARLSNTEYPIIRPLYLLHWAGRKSTDNFIAWSKGGTAAGILANRYILPEGKAAAVKPKLNYTGSSTVGLFIQLAASTYKPMDIEVDTEPESAGGEKAIVEGKTSLAGIAKAPETSTLRQGIASKLLAYDAIAVICHPDLNIKSLSSSDLKEIYTGVSQDWSQYTKYEGTINAYLVGRQSATRKVFQANMLGEHQYAGYQNVANDASIIDSVRSTPGSIGFISKSFLSSNSGVNIVAVNNIKPVSGANDYPLLRPLHLLWNEGDSAASNFAEWTSSSEAQTILEQLFMVPESNVNRGSNNASLGYLQVFTETFPVLDAGVFYYPHQSYELLDTKGNLVRNVENHLTLNDESPAIVSLDEGEYRIRTRSNGAEQEYIASVARGQTTKLIAQGETAKTSLEQKSSGKVDSRVSGLKLFGDLDRKSVV